MPASPFPGEEWLPGCILTGLREGERVCGCPSSSYEDTGPGIVSPPPPNYDLIYFSHLLASSVQIRSHRVLGLQHRNLGWGKQHYYQY